LAEDRIIWRGDSHYGRVEAMEWAEDNDSDYISGLAGNALLDARVAEIADNLRFDHRLICKEKLRAFTSFTYQASRWKRPRKVVARLECSLQSIAGESDRSIGNANECCPCGARRSSSERPPTDLSLAGYCRSFLLH
jgi:hypothetical protein